MNKMNWKHTGRFCFTACCMDFSGGMFFVALPFLAMQFGAESLAMGCLGGARWVIYAISCIGAGLISDRSDRKKLLIASSLSIMLICWATATTTTLWHLFAINVFSGLALSFFWPSLLAWLGDSHNSGQLGAATGAVNISWSTGGMVGGLLGGVLFRFSPSLPFLVAGMTALIACMVLLFTSKEHVRPEETPYRTSETGSRKELTSAWLGSFSAFCLVGLMCSVFPKLGIEIGITSSKFGVFVGIMGLGRTLVFVLGMWRSRWLCDRRISMPVQALAASAMAMVPFSNAHWRIGLVFALIGIATGIAYYRSLYASLAGEGSRGLKSGIHEATLVAGILTGSVGGGVLAHFWDIRAPYIPIAGLALLVLIIQGLVPRANKTIDSRAVS